MKTQNAGAKEICGVVKTGGVVVELPNTYRGNKQHAFDMEIEVTDDIIAVWHSHPVGPPWPSHDDIPCMEEAARRGYKFNWLIVMPGTVCEYTVGLAQAHDSKT